MALPSSGPLSIGQIRNELVTSNGSLRFLSARAGKSAPDSISEFYGYQYPPGYITYYQNTGQLYDGCSMSMDSYGEWYGTAANGGGIGPFGSSQTTNTERGNDAGTFLTFGGNGTGTVQPGSTVTVVAYSNGYGACPCQPIYSFINVDGVRRANTNTTCGFTQISYSFTINSGQSYSIEWGVWYGTV
jgi:hypothetical protein